RASKVVPAVRWCSSHVMAWAIQRRGGYHRRRERIGTDRRIAPPMPTVTMPQLGESVAEGTIGKWLKQVGDQVAVGEPIVEVVTDKVNAEVPSPFAGTLTKILVEEGATVPNEAEIAVIE